MPTPSASPGLSFVPRDVLRAMKAIHDAGFDVWLVGGALRDFFLELDPQDWDLATDASPQQIMEIFPRVIPVGIRHGTVQVHTRDRDIEVTGFDPPGDAGIVKDLGRRDFTINAMALSYPGGALLDPFGGREDLKRELIRGVLDPVSRFSEDPLRIVRAGRLAAVYGFSVEPETFEAMRGEAENVDKVSGERIRDELCKILVSSRPIEAFDLLRKAWTLGKLLPELVIRGHIDTYPGSGVSIYRHSMLCVHHCPRRPRVRLAALFHEAGVPAIGARDGKPPIDFRAQSAYMASVRLKKWNVSNRQIEDVTLLIENQLPPDAESWSDAAIRRFIAGTRPELLDDFVALAEAERLAEGGTDMRGLRRLRERMREQVGTAPALRIKDMAISGRDVMALLDLPPGPAVGKALRDLFHLVLEDPSLNTRDRLLEIVAEKAGERR